MFDFRRWSMDVYYYAELLERSQESGDTAGITQYTHSLENLWNELMTQPESPMGYLKQLLGKTRRWVNGDLSQEELDHLTQEIRENVLKDL